jgi:5-methylthioadenosine/S-adenosylhomocysteine deaminase
MPTTEQVDLMIEHGLVITVDGQRRILTDGAIAVRDDRILAVDPTPDMRQRYAADRTIDATDRVVIPGLVDSHLHLTEGARGFVPDDTPPMPWIYEWICPLFACLTPDEEHLLSKLVLTEALKTGTTTFVEGGTLKYPEAAIQAVEETGIRANLGRWTWDLPPEPEIFRQSAEEALASYEDLIAKWNGAVDGRVSIWVHLIGVGSQSDDLLVGAKDLADKSGVGVTQHQSNVEEEVEEFRATHEGKRPMEHFAELGVLDRNVRFIHMIAVDQGEVELIREFDVKPVHSVLCALNLGYGATAIGRYPEMLEAGISVSLGCDGANCSNSFDMVRAMFAVAGIYKDRRRDVSLVPAEQAIEMATINGAESILSEDQIGSLEPGKKADIVLFDANRPEWLPMINVVNNLVYSADGRSVDTVLVDGQIVVEGGRMTRFDEDELYEEVKAINWAERFTDRTGLPLRIRWPVT